MTAIKLTFILLLFNLVLPAFSAAYQAPLPTQAAPDGLKTFDMPEGGRILFGKPGDSSSGPSTFKSGLRRTKGYFDTSLNLLSVVRSKNGEVTMGSFSAILRGTAVGGLAISMYDPDGHSRLAFLFDDPNHLAKSIPSMMRRLDELTQEMLKQETVKSAHSSNGKAFDSKSSTGFAGFEAASRNVALKGLAFPDGTTTIGVAPGFKPHTMSAGTFTASSADGATIELLVSHSLIDPNGTLYKMQAQMTRRFPNASPTIPGQIVVAYEPDPVIAWKKYLTEYARQQNTPYPDPQITKHDQMHLTAPGWSGRVVSGTMTLHDETFVFTGRLLVSPPSLQGGWMLQATILAAPKEHVSDDMPAMMAMEKSEKVDMNATRELTMRNIDMINAQSAHQMSARQTAYDVGSQQRFNSSMARARASRDAMDKSTAGFIHYINGTTILQHNPSGGHATVEANLAGALEKSDPQHFSVVPVKQYVKGRDY